MAMDFSKFDSMVDLEGLKKDIEDAKAGSGEYTEVPKGTYEVTIEKMELTESKSKHEPMVSVWFKILEGDFKNNRLFMNQVITKGFQIHIVNEFLRSLETGKEVEFKTYQQYNDLLMDIHEEAIDKHEYAVEYGEKNGFNTFKVVEVFDVEE